MTRRREPPSVYREDLMTEVYRVIYDVPTRTGTITMPPYCCTDMSGAIALFERIDPRVTRIDTIAGDQLDTVYRRAPGGDWEASLPSVTEPQTVVTSLSDPPWIDGASPERRAAEAEAYAAINARERAVWHAKARLTPDERMVLSALVVAQANINDQRPSVRDLAFVSRVPARTVRAILARLTRRGVLRVVERATGPSYDIDFTILATTDDAAAARPRAT